MVQTHEVLNQVPPLKDYNLFEGNTPLREAVKREGAAWAEKDMKAFGKKVGEEQTLEWGRLANLYSPVLRTHDRLGNRVDQVEFHPAWHELMRVSVEAGLAAGPWAQPIAGAHVARAAKMLLMAEVEYGHLCPVSMTYSAVPALRANPKLAKIWEPKILAKKYDPSFQPAPEKKGVLFGMAMTEKQGGSDVRANTTRAEKQRDGSYRLTGHKWFCSAPMNDAFLVLAQTNQGLSCFLLPRFTPQAEPNTFFIQRLKDKLGNRSNASSEVEFEGAYAQRIGEEGRGVPTIIEMVNHTRLDCVLGSTALMRQGLVQAVHHARHRRAFGRRLIEQDLMKNVLADLALESEAATILATRLARAYDSKKSGELALKRIGTAVAKFWICKRTPVTVAEALECLGGNGFVEEALPARLFRESPLNSIWEGSGNVICLDVMRAAQKEPESLAALLEEIELTHGEDKAFDHWVHQLKGDFSLLQDSELRARRLVENLALAWQASLLLRFAPAYISQAFVHSRIAGKWGRNFGTLGGKVEFEKILERAW